MSLLAKLRCITVDVTGTLLAYKGELGEYYCMAAKAVGLECPDYKRVHEKYPCFRHAAKMSNIMWWKTCVRDSFIRGTDWDFGVFSGIEGVEKANPRIYELVLERAGNLSLDKVLHIGDRRKDYVPATALGCMHCYWIGSRHLMPMSGFFTTSAKEWLTTEKSAS